MPESTADREVRLIVPRVIGSEAANEVAEHRGAEGYVVRAALLPGASDTFDLRVLNESLTRSVLARTRPDIFPAVVPPGHGAEAGVSLHSLLSPLPSAANAAEHDRQLGSLIERLAVLASESGDAARLLRPFQKAEVSYLAMLGPDRGGCRLEHAALDNHFAVARADAVRVASAVRGFLGRGVLRAAGLPGPRGLARRLPSEPSIPGRPGPHVVAHGDPTTGNLMIDADGSPVLNDFDLAYVAEARHAAAHTWAALRLRSAHEPSEARRAQFLADVPAAAEAAAAGLMEAYESIEVGRSAYVDFARAVVGKVSVETAWRSLHRFNGPRTLGLDALAEVVGPLRASFADRVTPALPPGLLVDQPSTLDPVDRAAITHEKMAPLEARLLALHAATEAAMPPVALPDAVREAHEQLTALARQRIAVPTGMVPIDEVIAQMRDSAAQLTIADDTGRVLVRVKRNSPEHRKTRER
ncbi:MAG: phosphotransferase [Streptomycetaceae bacterium]|nr:phosphotransferase [Streptomycetaceae bacterium]